MVRQGFPLFTGSQLNVSIHKSWTTYPLFVIICWKKIKTHIVGVRKKKECVRIPARDTHIECEKVIKGISLYETVQIGKEYYQTPYY